MGQSIRIAQSTWRATLLCAVILFTAGHIEAQSNNPPGNIQPDATPSPTQPAKPSLEHRFFANLLDDQRAIWTSPFHTERSDMKWLVPLGLSTAALIATDRHTAGALADSIENRTRQRISRDISWGGNSGVDVGVAATFYLVGRATHNSRARETGLLGAEALIDSGIVVQVLKAATQRPRPRVDDASGEFFDRGNSFPSGHAISAWSLATVISYEYGQRRPAVRILAYGIASAVSIARYTGRYHFLSDALVGSALGYGIGRYVYFKHHDTSLDAMDGTSRSHESRSRLLPLIAPQYSRAEHAYGLALAWSF
ncbi:MAG TPA: phosphatase PAP2 family protein [Pyrinomonadaceae bacterium]|nr:phosphatase PAP2 family protein [Pyrinomonadaceae bacterium]